MRYFFLTFTAFTLISSAAHSFEDDGSWSDGYYWYVEYRPASSFSPTKSLSCSSQGGTLNGDLCKIGATSYYVRTSQCYSGIPENSGCGTSPTPPEPQDCNEASQQHDQETSFVTLSSYAAEFCFDGCSATPLVMTKSGSSWTGSFSLSSKECNGGYQSGLGAQEVIDFYAHDAELQNCYDASGRLIGQISSDLSCPSLSVCYDSTTADPVGTTSQSTACETGVKYNELTQEQQAAIDSKTSSSDTTVINPDGSVTETTTTTETQTGLDGSTVETTETTTTEKDDQGNVTSEETTSQTTTENDESKPAANSTVDCGSGFKCEGDVLKCEEMRLQRLQACSLNEDAVSDWVGSADFQNNVFGSGDVNANGQLTALDGGSLNLSTELGVSSWMVDNGVTSECPGVLESGWVIIDITMFCNFFDQIRYVVLFCNGLLILFFFRRSFLEVE